MKIVTSLGVIIILVLVFAPAILDLIAWAFHLERLSERATRRWRLGMLLWSCLVIASLAGAWWLVKDDLDHRVMVQLSAVAVLGIGLMAAAIVLHRDNKR